MDRTLNITQEEYLRQVEEILGFADVLPKTPDILTVADVMEAFGCTRDVAACRLLRAVRAGLMEKVKVWASGKDGRRIVADGYRLVKERKEVEGG